MHFSNYLLLLCLIIFIVFTNNVDAHAKLNRPLPWNPEPSRTGPCGAATAALSYPRTAIDPTRPLLVQWQVVAADGNGRLIAAIDPTAKTNPRQTDFTVALTTTPGTANNPRTASNIPYTISFQIPAGTKCTGPGDICTLQVRSITGWVACATITLTTATTTSTSTPATRRPATQAPATQAPTSTAATLRPATQAPATQPPAATNPPPIDGGGFIIAPGGDDGPANPIPESSPLVYAPPKPSRGQGGEVSTAERIVLSTASESGLEYRIVAPPPQNSSRPQGVLIFLHGSGRSRYTTGTAMFAQVAQKYDFIRVSALSPNRRTVVGTEGWNEGGAAAQIAASNQLYSLISKDLLSKYNIDTTRIFLTGQSSGGGFLSAYFVPMHAKDIAGGVFAQCGMAPPAPAVSPFQATDQTSAQLKLHFEITTGDTAWAASYAAAIRGYRATGLKASASNTKPGGHCQFDQQQVILDRIEAPDNDMLRKIPTNTETVYVTQSAAGDDPTTVYSSDPSTSAQCAVASGLTACPKVNGQLVQIVTTTNLKLVDITAQDAINYGLNNRAVISSTPSKACQDAYRDLICATYFTPCGTSTKTTCQATCLTANRACTFNTTKLSASDDSTHAAMYDCKLQQYSQVYADGNGQCAGAPGPVLDGDGDPNHGTNNHTPMIWMGALLTIMLTLFQTQLH